MVIERHFSTPNADYVWQGINHDLPNLSLIEADLLMLENGKNSLDSIEEKPERSVLGFLLRPDHGANLRHHIDGGKPILFCDSAPKRSVLCGELFGYLCELPIDLLCNRDVKKRYDEETTAEDCRWAKIVAMAEVLYQSKSLAARDAVIARKLEEFVAPMFRREFGRRPKIGMIMGLYHRGIEWHLRMPALRNLTIWNHQYLNLKPFAGLHREDVDRVLVARKTSRDYSFEMYSTGLFGGRE